MRTHIFTFNQWINESEVDDTEEAIDDTEEAIEEKATQLTARFEEIASSNKITTRDFIEWFSGMLALYDNTQLKGLVFNMMKEVWPKYYKAIEPLLTMANKELSKQNISDLQRFKKITKEESTYERGTNDLLKEYL